MLKQKISRIIYCTIICNLQHLPTTVKELQVSDITPKKAIHVHVKGSINC